MHTTVLFCDIEVIK